MGGYASPLPTRRRRSPPISDFAPYDPDEDPRQMFRNERARSTAFGDITEQEYQDTGPGYLDLEEGYRGRGDQLYDELLQNPGLTPEEIQQFVREQELIDMGYSPEEAQDQMLSVNEQNQIRGNPYDALAGLNPDQMLEIANQGGRFQREAIERSAGGIIRPTTFDPALLQDEGYGGRQRGTVGSLESNVRGAIDPETLRLDPEFAENYPITDEEIRQTEQLGSRSAAQPFNRAMDEAARRAAASGSVPGAIGALGDRLARGAAVEQGYAATAGRLGGLELQREQRRQRELMRQDAERDLAGRRTEAEFGLADTSLGAESDIERGRLSAAQNRAGLITDSELALLREGLDTERGTAANIQRAAEFNQGKATDVLSQAEQRAADRAAATATNRQDAARYASGERFNRGIDINDRLSGRYGATADARRTDQQEGRQRTDAQQAQAGARQSEVAQQRLQGREISQQGSLGAAEAAGRYDIGRRSAPNFFTKNVLPTLQVFSDAANSGVKKVMGAEGVVIDEPTLALMGEGDETEYVIPESKMPEVSIAVQRVLRKRRPMAA